MAQRTEVYLLDDVDGSNAAETVRFALDGTSYEIDLSEANATALRAAYELYVERGRRTGGRKEWKGSRVSKAPGAAPAAKPTTETKVPSNSKTVREWAASQPDIKLADRGRIPTSVMVRFEEAMSL